MKTLTWKQFAVLLLIILGLILAFSPIETSKMSEKQAIKISKMIVDREDHITAEQLGHLIIDKDPDYILIDLRTADDYQKYHINSAMNIPLEKLLLPETLQQLDRDKLLILYSNGGTHAAQAWVLLYEEGIRNATVLLGGLNYWVDVYTNPNPPEGVYDDSEIFRYQFLKSAGKYLMGDQEISDDQPAQQEVPTKIKPIIPKKKKKRADAGC